MEKFSLLPFQVDAVEELTNTFVEMWKNPDKKMPLVFKSPTGSGKTFMMGHFINGLNQLPNWDPDKAFIWITFSDDIAMQSKEKFQQYFENTLKNDLLTVEDIGNGKMSKNNILFLNWQKIVSRAAENRVLRRPDEEEMRKESGYYFEDFIENTKNDGREIILIIDEVHKHTQTSLTQDQIDFINPKVIIGVSATPENEPSISDVRANKAGYVEVLRDRVVEEGLIKEKIIMQANEDLQKHKDKDLDHVLLDLAIEKHTELKAKLAGMGKKINPLILVQLPNDDNKLLELGERKKEQIVSEYLLGIGVDERKIGKWFDSYPKPELIEENDDEHDFLLFKQAVGTGWDCPRAHVLVMYRDIKSSTFFTQTVGRILRMPEPDKKEDYSEHPGLRAGYLFTNYGRKDVVEDWSKSKIHNKPAVYKTEVKEEHKKIVKTIPKPSEVPEAEAGEPGTIESYEEVETLEGEAEGAVEVFELESAYIPRVEYGDFADSAKFQESFLKSMDAYFKITKDDQIGEPREKVKTSGVQFKDKVMREIIVDAEFEDYDNLSYEMKDAGQDVDFQLSQNDVEKTFNYMCYQLLKEQTDDDAKYTNLIRSVGPLKSALRIWLRKAIDPSSKTYYPVFINDILLGAASKFRPAITKALKEYRPVLDKILEDRRKRIEEIEAPIFTIKDTYTYTDEYEEIEQQMYVHDKFYLKKEYLGRENELEFLRYIDSKTDDLEWWFKNFDQGKDAFSLKYFNTAEQKEKLFHPDWIIKCKDGRIGIFDTKSGITLNTEGRAKGLAERIEKFGEGFVGGIVKKSSGTFVYCDSKDYDDQVESNNEWKPFEELFT